MQNKEGEIQGQLINFSSYLAAWNAVDRSGHWAFQLAAVTFLYPGQIQNTGQQSYTVKSDIPNGFGSSCFFLAEPLILLLLPTYDPLALAHPTAFFMIKSALMSQSWHKDFAILHFHGKAITDHPVQLLVRLSHLKIFFKLYKPYIKPNISVSQELVEIY